MKHLLVSTAIAMSALIAAPVMAQDSSATAPAVTMQPIPNPPEPAKPMGKAHKAKHAAKHHAKKAAAKADDSAPAAPAK